MTKIRKTFGQIKDSFWLMLNLTGLIVVFLLYQGLKFVLLRWPNKQWLERLNKIYQSLIRVFERRNHNGNTAISRMLLIELSLQNLAVKKSRTLITIGGMAVGIGSIVFLVSIGYGLQDLVVSRVARLEELKQTDVIAQPNSELKIDDEALSKFQNLQEVDQALPMIAVVGRVEYQQAMADMAAYGVTTEYLARSAVQPVRGQLFDSSQLTQTADDASSFTYQEGREQVAGVFTQTAEFGRSIQVVKIEIEPEVWLRVRSQPSAQAEILGYTKRPAGQLQGEQVWGAFYEGSEAGRAGTNAEGEELGQWVKTRVDLWEKNSEGYQPVLDQDNSQQQAAGYIAQLGMQVEPREQIEGQVLGIADSFEVVDSDIDWVELATESAQAERQNVQTVELGNEALRQIVVNRAVLNVLGISEQQALGETLTCSFVVMGKALDQPGEKITSLPADYEITAVIPGEETPMLYVPFIDLRSLGVINYSQAKLVASNQDLLQPARHKVEAMGFVTRSVVDTVNQIESIFATTRTVLAFLGMAALLVAALGMFNTLTVSLLERTREVGLMKALGMKSEEVQELFMIESLSMGLLGGLLGILLGFAAGKLLSLVLSAFSLIQGVGWLNVAVIPIGFVFLVLFLAVMVGIVTGLYPAKRATNISALNALRYE